MISSTLNTDEVIAKFNAISYDKLSDTFRSAIQKSIDILKRATESEMASAGFNASGGIVKKGTKYGPMINGVVAEVAMDGTEGRVRIAPASKKGYVPVRANQLGLMWFESGTEERFKKGSGYTWKANTNKKQGGARKHRNKGASTGQLRDYNFFKNAYESTAEEMNRVLEENINKAINEIMNR